MKYTACSLNISAGCIKNERVNFFKMLPAISQNYLKYYFNIFDYFTHAADKTCII